MSHKIKQNFGLARPETLVIIALLIVLVAVVILAVNPIDQLRRAKDLNREFYASELLGAIDRYNLFGKGSLNLAPIVDSLSCEEIINSGPVADISSLKGELSAWFPKKILGADSRLYVGLLKDSGMAKVCFQVSSAGNIAKALQKGCFNPPKFYRCLPE